MAQASKARVKAATPASNVGSNVGGAQRHMT
jgi:hypothetical protein